MRNTLPEVMENVKKTLKNNGYKLTPQRRALINTVIENEGKHLTAEELYSLVKNICPEIGLATVYRTLQLMDRLDILCKLELDDGCSRYELVHKNENHRHHHLICTNCGKVIEVKEDLLEELENDIETTYEFKVYNHSLKFYGLCKKCYNEKK